MAENYYGKHGDEYYRHFPSFLRLFRYEFDKLLEDKKFVEYLKNHLTSFMVGEKGPNLKLFLESNELAVTPKHKELLFHALRKIPDSDQGFWEWLHNTLIWYTDPASGFVTDETLNFMLKNPPTEEKEHFDKFFDPEISLKLDVIADCLSPKELFSEMEKIGPEEYGRILRDYVVPRWNETYYEFYYGVAEFLLRLFYCKPGRYNEKEHSWYWDFFSACRKNVGNGTLLRFIQPIYRRELDMYIVKLKTENREIAAMVNEDYVTEETIRKAVFRPPPGISVTNLFRIVDEDTPNSIELRSYQRELVRHAVEGENTIICAPTGSGKTIVAVEVIRNHLETRNVDAKGRIKQKSRVAFIVPTVPLVEQQCRVIKNYLSADYKIQGFSGADNRDMNTRTKEIIDTHIVVITPQMLVNMLQSVNKHRRLYITDFTLFVLDECHHCGANHPYELMMKLVRQYAEETKKLKLEREIPQVVGLTASLGADSSAYDTDRTQNKILSLCVRMLATQLSTVRSRKNLRELRNHVNPPIDEICRCRRSPKDEFRDNICSMMLKIVEDLKDKFVMIEKHVESLKEFKFPKLQEVAFSAAVNRLIDSRKSWPDHLEEEKRFVAEACYQLLNYARVLQMNDLLPAFFAFEFMKMRFAELFENEVPKLFADIYDDNIKQLEALQEKDLGDSKEILNKLKSIIRQEYSINSNTRTLIFVETRNLALSLSSYLSNSGALMEFAHEGEELAAYLTSTNAAKKDGGLSPEEQKSILNKFDQGLHKILVVTSVAEEGLDISACNMIIKYNTVGSERTMIQRRGRARALDSKSILVCLDEDVEQRELTNIMREINMKLCLQDLQSKSSEQLKVLIDGRREKIEFEEQEAAKLKQAKIAQIDQKIYNIQCIVCHHTLCKSDQIRTVIDSHYCCIYPKIWDNLKIGFGEGRLSAEMNITTCAPFKCSNCSAVMGNIIKYADVFLPSIKHTEIALQEAEMIMTSAQSTDRITKQKWKDIEENYFAVEPISVETLVGITHILSQECAEDYNQLHLQAEYAVQHQLEKLRDRQKKKDRYRLGDE